MGRPSNREQRRAGILRAFARVLADHGFAGATIASIAAEAGLAPGLVHHHFTNKDDLLRALVRDLVARFRQRALHYQAGEDPLLAYVDGALKLDERADHVSARCWVGVFAEAVRNPSLFAQMRTLPDTEISSIELRSGGGSPRKNPGACSPSSLVLSFSAPLHPEKPRSLPPPACAAWSRHSARSLEYPARRPRSSQAGESSASSCA